MPMPNITELARLVGKTGLLPVVEGFAVQVRIVDAKVGYGRARLVVEPVSGTGRATVNLDRVAVDGEPAKMTGPVDKVITVTKPRGGKKTKKG